MEPNSERTLIKKLLGLVEDIENGNASLHSFEWATSFDSTNELNVEWWQLGDVSEPNPEPVYQLTQSELDNLFQDLLLTESPDTGRNAYDNAYQSGKEDGIRQFHKEVESKAAVVVE